MNTQATSSFETPANVPQPAPRTITALGRLYWSIRRELWENRSIYIAPLTAGGVVLLGFVLLVLRIGHISDLSSAAAAPTPGVILLPYHVAAGIVMLAAAVVSVFYCLDALHGERRDRSVLFWKSLPVSDAITVLAKASIPLLILPLIAWAVAVLTQLVILVLSSALRLGGPGSAASLWSQAALLPMSGMLLYHLIAVHSLWYAPLYGWLLLVSAWARRATFLWAFLPPLAVVILERIVFNSSHFADLLHRRFSGGMETGASLPGSMPIDPGTQITLGRYLSTPGLWLGLLLFAVFLAGAVQLRRYREAL